MNAASVHPSREVASAPVMPNSIPARVAIRTADDADLGQIEALQRLSITELGSGYYSALEIEAFLRFMPMMERYLIADRTYFVAEADGRIVGCGGWSRRAPGYSGAVPNVHGGAAPARVRAMYVHPRVARRGIGRALLQAIERAIAQAGYEEAGLDAILPGVPLYERCGYERIGDTYVGFPNGVRLAVVSMYKRFERTPGAE